MDISDLRFLVVEDDAFQRATLIEVVSRLAARSVCSASDGQEGLDILLKQHTPLDVILCDLKMPVMDGLEFVRHVGKAGFRGSIVIASALNQTLLAAAEAMTNAYGINLLGSVSKPVTPAALEALLAHHGTPQPKLRALLTASPSFGLDEI